MKVICYTDDSDEMMIYFLGKIKKKKIKMSSAAVVIGALKSGVG